MSMKKWKLWYFGVTFWEKSAKMMTWNWHRSNGSNNAFRQIHSHHIEQSDFIFIGNVKMEDGNNMKNGLDLIFVHWHNSSVGCTKTWQCLTHERWHDTFAKRHNQKLANEIDCCHENGRSMGMAIQWTIERGKKKKKRM